MKPRIDFVPLLWLMLLAGAGTHGQQTSRIISFSGLQTNIAPSTSGQQLTLQLWDTAGGGSPLYCENQTLDVDDNGAIRFVFGAGTAPPSPCPSSPPGLDPANFPSGSSRYLDVVDANGNSVLAERMSLTAGAFALSPGPQGPAGPKGDQGDKGDPGAPGVVQAVTAADGSIIIAGTVSNPAVAVANGGITPSHFALPLQLTGTSANPILDSANSGNGAGLSGSSPTLGVRGSSNSGIGVLGGSTSGSGVRGTSQSGFGVFGGSDSGTGVHGESVSGAGVRGEGTATNGVGVFGRGSSNGVVGEATDTSTATVGVKGTSPGPDGWGVEGHGPTGVMGGSNGGIGVLGSSDGGLGVAGVMAGVFGLSSNGAGGRFDTSTGSILYGTTNFQARFRVDNTGKVFANGGFQGSGADFAESIGPSGAKSAMC